MADITTHFDHSDHLTSDIDLTSFSKKAAERDELSRQIEAFIESGGKINLIEPDVMADPPKKPSSNYGSQPI